MQWKSNIMSGYSFNWVFEKNGPRRIFRDGTERNFSNSFESLVRESIQNSNDSRLKALESGIISSDHECKMNFHYQILNKSEKLKFTEVINHNNILLNHLKNSGLIKYTNKELDNYFNGLNSKFSLLTIHDFNTTGLYGDELPKEENVDSPFSALCRDSGLSKKGDVEGKGGSYGMGKSVFWKFSKLNTVLFLSYTHNNEKNKKQYRLFGLSNLGSHTIKNDGYDGIGEFGIYKIFDGRREYAESVWFDSTDKLSFLPENIINKRKGRIGTSIIIMGVDELETGNLQLYQNEFTEHIYKWFWPLLILNKLSVTVDINGEEKLDSDNIPETIFPFAHILRKVLDSDEDNPPKNIIHKELDVKFPLVPEKRKRKTYREHSYANMFCMKLGHYDKSVNTSMDNRIAWIRGANSVVKYKKVGNPGGSDRYFAIVLAGEAIKIFRDDADSEHFKLFDDFLRYAETPSHDDWNYKKSQLREVYGQNSGADTELSKILQKFSDVSWLLDEIEDDTDDDLPRELIAMFPSHTGKGRSIGTKGSNSGGGSGKGIRIKSIDKTRNNSYIYEHVEIKRSKNSSKNWKLKISAKLLDEFDKSLGEIEAPMKICYDNQEIDGNITDILEDNSYDFTVKIEELPEYYSEAKIALEYEEVIL